MTREEKDCAAMGPRWRKMVRTLRIQENKAMTNPNPVAPKTDTPETQEEVCYLCEGAEEVSIEVPGSKEADKREYFGCPLCMSKAHESTLAAERASRLQAEEALKYMFGITLEQLLELKPGPASTEEEPEC